MADCHGRTAPVAAVAALVLLGALAPGSAFAATRFASPNGTAGEPCNPDPCEIQEAVEGIAGGAEEVNDGDEVVLLSGDYDIGTDPLQSFAAIDLHGQAGTRPTIAANLTGNPAVQVNDSGATVRDLAIDQANSLGTGIQFAGGTLSRIYVESAGDACAASGGTATIRDSVCWMNGSGGHPALGADLSGGVTAVTARNVTAVSTATTNSDGIRFHAGTGGTVSLDARSVIAKTTATDPNSTDIEGTASDGGSVTVTLDHSNYATVFDFAGTGSTSAVTPASGMGSNPTNQTAAPVFADLAAGNFHQLPGSPTIDRGIADVASGTADPDGDPRALDGDCAGVPEPDIGADELVPDCSTPIEPQPEPGDTAPPETQITRGPKDKTRKKQATFEFAGSDARAVARFECSLDGAAFAACSSPDTFKVKKGKHSFAVRAVDGAGNADPTPATDSWKVKKPKK